ncbi:hypothetical protein LCGC14_1513630, partial [marine sediment metagenome]
RIHRLILETYIGPRPKGMECRHLNGNPADNRFENLCWGTHVENSQDSIKHGTHVGLINHGEKNGHSKLTDSIVVLIRQLWHIRWMNTTQSELAEMFGISQSRVSAIVNKKSWKHIWRI